MPQIDAQRLLGDLYALRKIGTYRTGVHRPSLSPDDVQSRQWLLGRMQEAGLDAEIDGIGNVIGRAPGAGQKLLTGSHLETQPYAGWLDGALGVIFGLEAARVMPGQVDVCAWFDEEGHFGSFLGSRSYCGLLTEDEIDRCVFRENGTPLRKALENAGFGGRPRQVMDPARYRGYLEAHIEQGPDLDDSGEKIGVVTAIVGSHRFRIVFEGVQNHAGTTRMPIRKDAGVALVRLANAIYDTFPGLAGPRTVWTTGSITLDPGAPSVVPGRAEMLFQFRDTDKALLYRLEEALDALVADANAKGPCKVTIASRGRSVPRLMDAGFQDALDRAAETHAPGKHRRMPSGAGHDAQVLAERLPSAMLFVPSIGGISHHFAEDTADADIALGGQVFADAAADILAG
jgi:N-carbamoyl-L-amino-acid hydrolase